jgi:hypothetical protein
MPVVNKPPFMAYTLDVIHWVQKWSSEYGAKDAPPHEGSTAEKFAEWAMLELEEFDKETEFVKRGIEALDCLFAAIKCEDADGVFPWAVGSRLGELLDAALPVYNGGRSTALLGAWIIKQTARIRPTDWKAMCRLDDLIASFDEGVIVIVLPEGRYQ